MSNLLDRERRPLFLDLYYRPGAPGKATIWSDSMMEVTRQADRNRALQASFPNNPSNHKGQKASTFIPAAYGTARLLSEETSPERPANDVRW
jgi:hypothetical protein